MTDRSRAGPTDWRAVARTLSEQDRTLLSGDDLDRLADALFWTDQVEPSIAARIDAHRAHVRDGRNDSAALAAWWLFYEHWLVGESVVGRGWLERGRACVDDPDGEAAGWIAVADTDVALREGDVDAALRASDRAVRIGEDTGRADLLGMALQVAGKAAIASGDVAGGLRRLDHAMILVIGNELTPLYTGWVYCVVIATCHDLADLRRASEWSEAALRWCETLRDGLFYPGLCRVYAAELALLRGDWSGAEALALRGGQDLEAHDERYAGAAHYLVGEVARLRGDTPLAEASYERAHRLGHSAQPGLALLMLARGDATVAVGALRSAMRPGPAGPLPRARLVCALAEVAVAADDAAAVELAEHELARLTDGSDSACIAAMARATAGIVAAWRGDDVDAMAHLTAAREGFVALRMPFEAARARARVAQAARRVGDELTARLEAAAALEVMTELGAAEAEQIAALAGGVAPESPLTERELEVLRLVAAGRTNRQIGAALFLSPHTIARHLANIYAKLDVGSRAAATAWASRNGLLDPPA